MTRQKPSTAKRIAVWTVGLLIIGPGGYGFVGKLIDFIRTLRLEEGGGFAIIPLSNYFFVAAGMACLLIWAICNGMLRDIEGPKYTMLEREAELDRLEGFQEK